MQKRLAFPKCVGNGRVQKCFAFGIRQPPFMTVVSWHQPKTRVISEPQQDGVPVVIPLDHNGSVVVPLAYRVDVGCQRRSLKLAGQGCNLLTRVTIQDSQRGVVRGRIAFRRVGADYIKPANLGRDINFQTRNGRGTGWQVPEWAPLFVALVYPLGSNPFVQGSGQESLSVRSRVLLMQVVERFGSMKDVSLLGLVPGFVPVRPVEPRKKDRFPLGLLLLGAGIDALERRLRPGLVYTTNQNHPTAGVDGRLDAAHKLSQVRHQIGFVNNHRSSGVGIATRRGKSQAPRTIGPLPLMIVVSFEKLNLEPIRQAVVHAAESDF